MNNQNQKTIMKALLATFPSPESFQKFKAEPEVKSATIQKFIQHAFKYKLIHEETEEAFLEFLEQSPKDTQSRSLEVTSFAHVLDLAKQNLSEGELARRLAKIATEDFDMPKIQSTTITRLKDSFRTLKDISRLKENSNTSKRRLALRVLAYWIALKRSDDLHWNYEKFFLCEGVNNTVDPHKGVEVLFKIQARGDTIEPKTMKWVHKELLRCIDSHHEHIKEKLRLPTEHLRKENIRSSAVSMRLRLFKRSDSRSEQGFYTYIPAIRDGLAIAHQMAVRWLLSEDISPQRSMMIVLHAGDFSQANMFLQPVLEEHISEPSMIILNELAYQCAQVASLKVAFKQPQRSIDLGRGQFLKPWLVDYFWLLPYFDFVPKLLKIFPKDNGEGQDYQSEIVKLRQKFPNNPLLLMEIVKVLLARKEFDLADNMLTDILVLHPHHVLARISRMSIYEHIASQQTCDLEGFELASDRAFAEAQRIPEDCTEPEAWCAIGDVCYGRASSYLRFMRILTLTKQSFDTLRNEHIPDDSLESLRTLENQEFLDERRFLHAVEKHIGKEHTVRYRELILKHASIQPENEERLKQNILSCLEQAGKHFLRAISLAPDGKDIRSLALYTRAQVLWEQAKHIEHLLVENLLRDDQNISYNVAMRFFKLAGLLSTDFPKEIDVKALKSEKQESITLKKNYMEFIDRILAMSNRYYKQSVLSSTFTPNTLYFFGCFLWDYAPVLTKSLCYFIYDSFNKACKAAKELHDKGLSIYILSNVYSQQDSEKIITCIDASIHIVKETLSQEELQEGGDYWNSADRQDGRLWERVDALQDLV
jgi:tetratricopeptide (TPR) repeat protein